MCKGEAPIKARCLVFFTSLLHICYGYTLVTRSSNCRESGRVHWRRLRVYLEAHRATLRTAHHAPHPTHAVCGRGPPPPLSRGGRPHSSSHGLPRQLELGAHSSHGLRIGSQRTPARSWRLTVAMMPRRPSSRTLAPRWTRARLGRRSTAAPSASSSCSAPSCSRAATASAAAAGCAYSRAARRGQLLAAPAE